MALLDGFTGHGSDDITTSVLDLSHSLWVSVSVSNLLTSVSDKLLAGFVSLAVIESLPRGWAPERCTWSATPAIGSARAYCEIHCRG